MNPCLDDEGFVTACLQEPDPPKEEPEHPNAWAIAFYLALFIGLIVVEYKTRPSTGRRSPSRFMKKYTGRVLKLIGWIGFIVLGYHIFYGGPL